MLTEKSDVNSFGVVLLEIITSQPVRAETLPNERIHTSQWVDCMVAKQDIANIADPRLQGNFKINSLSRAIDIAMACVYQTSASRPTMTLVATGLKECLAME